MTLIEILGDFFESGWSDWNDAGPKLARAKRLANQVQADICNDQPWPFLEATVTGAAPLTIADVRQVRSVRDQIDKRALRYAELVDLDEHVEDLSETGDPAYWYRSSQTQISVYPVAAHQLQVRYVKRPAALVDDSDVSIIPPDWHGLIPLGMQIRAARFKDNADADALPVLRQEYEMDLGRMRDAELFRELEGTSLGSWHGE